MKRYAWMAGVLLQGLVLGALLFVAITRLMSATGVGYIFRYQGF